MDTVCFARDKISLIWTCWDANSVSPAIRATRKPRRSAYFNCVPSFLGFGIQFDIEAGAGVARRRAADIRAAGPRRSRPQGRRRACWPAAACEALPSRPASDRAQRGADAGKCCTYRAPPGCRSGRRSRRCRCRADDQERFVNRAGVVVQAAAIERSSCSAPRARRLPQRPPATRAAGDTAPPPFSLPATSVLELPSRISSLVPC